jgi:hypothetical protein
MPADADVEYEISFDVLPWWIALERIAPDAPASLRYGTACRLSLWWSRTKGECESEVECKRLWQSDPCLHFWLREWWESYSEAQENVRLIDSFLSVADVLSFLPHFDSEKQSIYLPGARPLEE